MARSLSRKQLRHRLAKVASRGRQEERPRPARGSVGLLLGNLPLLEFWRARTGRTAQELCRVLELLEWTPDEIVRFRAWLQREQAATQH